MKFAFFFLFLVSSLAWSAEQDVAAPFMLTVVPTLSSPQARTIFMADAKASGFYVVITNASKDAQPIFEDRNGWGYQNISFEFTMPDGNKLVVTKPSQKFFKDVPSTYLVPVGESRVFDIHFDQQWEGRPKLAEGNGTPIRLKAIYQVTATSEAIEHKVWTGSIKSKSYNLTLRHWRPD